MYEISLVPDVKSELLKKQKLRNLIFFICLIVAASCGGLILLLLGFIGTQSLEISAQENEINCRADGSGVGCGSYGTPVLKYPNVNELLTIQSQMKNVGVLNNNKIKFSLAFSAIPSAPPIMNRLYPFFDAASQSFGTKSEPDILAFTGRLNHLEILTSGFPSTKVKSA